jgi:hypothetical protein
LVSYGLLALAGCFSAVMPDAMDMSTSAMGQPATVPMQQVASLATSPASQR